jgi:proline iminopeptidase
MKTLYPDISTTHTFFLNTDSQHTIYIEESGTKTGIPVIFLHGGPCSGTQPHHRRFFNSEKYRIILMDQRGCGLSLPYGELAHNTTENLIDDIELLRQHLSIEKWLLFGGSWGGTLALLYAQHYPKNVSAMILRGTFLARQQDLQWFIEGGVNHIYPEYWQNLVAEVPNDYQHNYLEGLWVALTAGDKLTQQRVAQSWMQWNAQIALASAYQPNNVIEPITEKMLKQVKMELHYAKNHYFINENKILADCPSLSAIPSIIIHGRYDLMCPMEGAMALHKALPHAKYTILPHSGHVAQGDEMIDALVTATDDMADLLE